MSYDVIVVGAGSAGAIVAARLSEDPDRSVLLLEAGPDYPTFAEIPVEIKNGLATGADLAVGTDHDWQFTGRATDSQPEMPVPRGKITGGTSAINGQVFLRGAPEDFDTWASWGNDEWSFEKVMPYFRKLEDDRDFSGDWHGHGGPIPVRRHPRENLLPDQLAFYDACLGTGFPDCEDHNRPDSVGVGPLPLNDVDGLRWSTNLGYLNPARHRLNLTIRGEALAHRVILEGDRAVGVVAESGGEIFEVRGNEIVLSAGPIASPQLLMLSGIGPEDQLREQGIPVRVSAPGVGQNLRDHPAVHSRWKTRADYQIPPEAVGAQKVALRYTAHGSGTRLDMITVMRYRYETNEAVMTAGLFLARSAGELRLQSADPAQQPYLDFNYLSEPFDLERLRNGLKLNIELAKRPEFRRIISELVSPEPALLDDESALDEWIRRNVGTMHHISGTAKMGPDSDPMAVLDQYCRVKGIEGLRVADGSVMPDCIRANTNATIMMIGERVADFIRDRSRAGSGR